LEDLDFAMFFTLAPMVLVFYGAIIDIYPPSYPKSSLPSNDNRTFPSNDNSTFSNSTGTKIKRSTLIPKVGNQPMHDTNGAIYLSRHFEQNVSLYSLLQKKMIQRCVSNRAIDRWNFLYNLDTKFQVYNIKENDRAHVIMAALNISKLEESNFGFIDNRKYTFSSNELMIATHIAKYCLLPQSEYNRFLNNFHGASYILGGTAPNNQEFLEKLEKQQKDLERRNRGDAI